MSTSETQIGFAERHGAEVLLGMGIVTFAFGGVTFVTDSELLGALLSIVGMVAVVVATRIRQLTTAEVEGSAAPGLRARVSVGFRRR